LNAAGFEAEALPGSRGQYDVIADGRLVFSKADSGRFPEPGEVRALLG
jgi:selT/selW/selH-like putative selenoprotein